MTVGSESHLTYELSHSSESTSILQFQLPRGVFYRGSIFSRIGKLGRIKFADVGVVSFFSPTVVSSKRSASVSSYETTSNITAVKSSSI